MSAALVGGSHGEKGAIMSKNFKARAAQIAQAYDVKKLKALLQESGAIEQLNALPDVIGRAFERNNDDDAPDEEQQRLFQETLILSGIDLNVSDRHTPLAQLVTSTLWDDDNTLRIVPEMLKR